MITRKKIEFINWYIKTKNATESAKRSGYSEKTAYSQGQRLLKNDEVAKELARRFKAIDEAMQLTDDNIVKKLWDEANTASRSSDRTQALAHLARIRGLMKDAAPQNIAVFSRFEKEVDGVTRRASAQGVEVKEDKKII